ncbi:MAG: prepilin peptidase, partial [Candidatus Saccharimonadales bacterium]
MTSVIVLGLLGLCFGSFVNALVWRIRKKRDIVRERSECTHCHHILAWYDLVPVVSYLLLRGRCRYCRKPIDDTPLTELATALLFVISYLAWPYQLATVADWSLVVLWLVLLVGLVALADYDIRWYLLPDVIVFPLIVL